MFRKIAKVLLPKNSFRRKTAKKILGVFGITPPVAPSYYSILYQQGHQQIIAKPHKVIQEGPLISIIVPAYNTKQRYLEELINSIIAQTYDRWELIIVNASDDSERKKAVESISARDQRITTITIKNTGIAGNTNEGIKHANGGYISFCDHDDTLDPDALYETALAIVLQKADMIYTDEDKMSDSGDMYYDPHYKPDWSPDLLTHVNYINHFTTVRKDLVQKAGMLNPDRDGAQDYDLLLRVTDLKPRIIHVPKVLYHWRAADASTARSFSLKPKVTEAAKKSLEDHFQRLGVPVKAIPKSNRPGFYNLSFQAFDENSVIIMPFAPDSVLRLYNELLIKQSEFTSKTKLIVPNGTLPRFETPNVTIEAIKVDDTYFRRALDLIDSESVIVINTVAFPEDKKWVESLPSHLRQAHIRAVSPQILADQDIIDDCGLVKYGENYLPLFKNQTATANQTYFGNTEWVRNVDRLTGGIVALRTPEIKEFFSSTPQLTYSEAVKQYTTLSSSTNYNLLVSSIRFNRLGIRVPLLGTETHSLNMNLDPYGDGYTQYTPDDAMVSIFMNQARNLGVDL